MFGVIVNPVSGGGKKQEALKKIEALILERGDEMRLFPTEAEGDGDRQARLALESGCDAVVCVGGDGTLSEVVDAMAGSGKTLYIVPSGTGNDFARAFGLPKDPVEAFRAQLDGEEAAIDCGSLNGRAFINVSGSGFDVEVLRKTEELKAVYPGEQAYTKAVLAVLSSYKAFETEISLDGGEFKPYKGTIVEIANGQYFGGGMLVAPRSSFQDGVFDVVTVDKVPRMVIPFLLPLFKLGLHVHLPIARVVRAKEVVLRAKGMVINIDGNLKEMDEARYCVMPGALRVRLPKK
ncbi:MAG: diacylglycerol kinase family lipid kinase [Clostridiales bacterium]|nr:diacylglycerol kinase family lipid kinase [Clostridiales bacterium]